MHVTEDDGVATVVMSVTSEATGALPSAVLSSYAHSQRGVRSDHVEAGVVQYHQRVIVRSFCTLTKH